MAKRPRPIADQLRQAIRKAERADVTRYAIAQESGVSQATLSLLVNDKNHQIKLETAERIADAIGLQLSLINKPK